MEGNILTQVLLPVALFIIMLGMGLSLVLNDFKRVMVYPKAVLIGLVNQLILLPLIAFCLADLWEWSGALAVGLMILAVCPGGVTSNLISHISKGDTALSVTLTAISSLITIITIPFIINYSLEHFMSEGQAIQLPVLKTIAQIVIITIIPISIGMLIRSLKPEFSESMDRPVRIVSVVFLVLIIVAAVLKEKDVLVNNAKLVGTATLLLNLLTMGLGYITSRLLKLNLQQSITISIESGVQNGTLAIAVAMTVIGVGEMAIPGAIYSLVMFFTGGFFMFYFGRRKSES